MADYDTNELPKDEIVDDVIAELCAGAPSHEIRKCLRLYEYGKTVRQLEKTFVQCSKQTIEDTLAYLEVTNQKDYVKPANINNLICRIQNLLPDTCSICKEKYRVKIGDTPLLSCAICGQEVHKSCIYIYSLRRQYTHGES